VKFVRLTVAAGFAYKSFWLGWLRVAIESSFSVVLRHRSFALSATCVFDRFAPFRLSVVYR
jgi:hypothetical protein